MSDVVRRNLAKEPSDVAKQPVTMRLAVESKEKLQKLSESTGRTVSSLIALAVDKFLDQQLGGEIKYGAQGKCRIRHAALPDTSVLRAFSILAPEKCDAIIRELNLPKLEFLPNPPEWRRLLTEVASGESDLVESVNWLPIFWMVKPGRPSPHCDWVVPFLQLFVGHHVFVHRELLIAYLTPEDISDFEEFRDVGKTGKDLSLRSLATWVRHSGDSKNRRAKLLEAMWADSVVGCQLGTDYHIAVRRLTTILANFHGPPTVDSIADPTIPGLDSLNRGFQEFRNGTVTAFIGNLLHTASLMTNRRQTAYLLAGPADLRVPSLNTLTGRKGLFDMPSSSAARDSGINGKVLVLWRHAVNWFRDEIINADTDTVLRQFITDQFPEFVGDEPSEQRNHGESSDREPIAVLKSLMQTWVKWFADADEASAFLGDEQSGNISATDLVQYYEVLCDRLNPSAQMPAPIVNDTRERAFWKFPTFAEPGARASASTGISTKNAVTKHAMPTVVHPESGNRKSGRRSRKES